MPEMMVVVSKVKKMVKEAGYRTGGDYVDALSTKIGAIVGASIEHLKADGKRKTLGAEDLQ